MRSEETSSARREIARINPLDSRLAPLPPLGNELMLLAERFLQSLDVKSSSRSGYRSFIRPFMSWVEETNTISPTRQDILAYKRYLESRELSSATISSYLVAVRQFFEWAEGMKLYPNVAKGIKGSKRPRGFRKDPLTVDQVLELFQSVCRDDLIGRRDIALLNLLVRTGIRTIESIRANIGDIRQNTGETVLWVHGKGRDSKDDFVVLTPNALKPINDYLQLRDEKSEIAPLFISHSNRSLNKRLSTRSVSRIIHFYLQRIGVASVRITPHSLRHTAITLSLQGGASIQEARALGRHSDINTTLTYAHNIDRVARAPERKIDRILAQG